MVEFDATKARITRYADLMRSYGVRNYDPGEWASPNELSEQDVARLERKRDRESDAVAKEIESMQLPRAQARRRCLECSAFSQPISVACEACGKRLYASMTDVEKAEWSAKQR